MKSPRGRPHRRKDGLHSGGGATDPLAPAAARGGGRRTWSFDGRVHHSLVGWRSVVGVTRGCPLQGLRQAAPRALGQDALRGQVLPSGGAGVARAARACPSLQWGEVRGRERL